MKWQRPGLRFSCYALCLIAFSWLQISGNKAYESGGFFQFAKYEIINYGWPMEHLSVRTSFVQDESVTIVTATDRRYDWVSLVINVVTAVLFASICTAPLTLFRDRQFRIWHLFGMVAAAALACWLTLLPVESANDNVVNQLRVFFEGRSQFDKVLFGGLVTGLLFGIGCLVVDGARRLIKRRP